MLDSPFFQRLNNISLYVYTTFYFCIHLLMDTSVDSAFWILLATVGQYCYEPRSTYNFGMFTFYSFEHKHRSRITRLPVILLLFFEKFSKDFFIVAVSFYMSTNSAQEFKFLYILAGASYFLYFYTILNKCKVISQSGFDLLFHNGQSCTI